MTKLKILFFYISFVLSLNCQNLQQILDKYLDDNIPSDTRYSISVFDLNTEKFLYQKNEKELLIPASTTKLYTSGCSIILLGFDYQLTTELSCDDLNLDDGIIDGNLYLKGEGDPKFSSSNLNDLVLQLKGKGINKITKDIIIDDSFFDKILLRDHWIEDEGTNVPLPPISAVTIDYNTAYVSVYGNKGTKTRPLIEFRPSLNYFKIVNSVRLSGNKSSIRINSTETTTGETITVSGSISKKRSTIERVLIKNPAKFIGYLLEKFLRQNGISFNGKIINNKSPRLTNIISSYQFPLIEIINETNKRSNNFLAEHLFKIIGGKYSGNDGGAYEATQSIFTLLKVNGLYEKDMSLVDGSGISRSNRFSSNALVRLLSHIYYLKEEFEPFYNSLGIAGMDGTVRNRMKNTLAENNCRAKTGTLNGVVALAGYVENKSKKMIAFSINFNFTQKYADFYRDFADKIVEIISQSE